MNIIDELLSTVETAAEVRDVRVGLRWTAVVVDRAGRLRGGISSALGGDCDHHYHPKKGAFSVGKLQEYSAADLAALLRSDDLTAASIGMATLNALLDVDEAECEELNAAEIIATRGAGKRVAIVGHFPFTPRIRETTERLWVLEKTPREDDLPADRAEEVIPQADVVAITGTAIINHTFDELVEYCRPDAYVVVLGGSTPLSPVLFEYGVDAVSGSLVVDIDRVLLTVSQGATFRQIEGISKLTLFRKD